MHAMSDADASCISVCTRFTMMGNWISSFRSVFSPGGRRRGSRYQPKPPSRADYTDGRSGGVAILTVGAVEPFIIDNAIRHHTDRFALVQQEKNPCLVVRRGQPIIIALTLSRAYNPETDAISFVFTFSEAEKPHRGQGSLVAVPLLPLNESPVTDWSAQLITSEENIITIQISPSAKCLVGQWQMDIDTKLLYGNAVSFSYKTPIYILFNPWSEDDQVYLEGENLRFEYVLSDTGLIWRGTANRLRPAVWKYAQFEKDILECSLYLIAKIGKVGIGRLGDPVAISRAISAAVNSPDDYGAVLGNWTTEFDGGTPPSKWLGSMKILQKYWKTKKPVKYGQCWVFAGVLATISRAIGIPARTITNYASAHDTQNSLTVDYFVDEKGKIMEELNSDSIWNFHVWNELWMTRPDLGDGDYDGWQAVDATPQELSDDMYRCGPASVVAVKRGQVLRPYDGGFLFSEVNADKLFWKYAGPTQPLKLLRKDITGIGQLMSTKTVGKWTREDITATYKHPEKSKDERDTMLKALLSSENLFSRYYLNEDFNDLHFDFALRDDIVIGSPFTVTVVVTNRTRDKDHKILMNLRVDVVTYTGKIGAAVKKQKFDRMIQAGTTEEISVEVTYGEYAKRMVDQGAFNIACLATVQETNYEYFAQDDFRVRKPDIKIQLIGEPTEGLEMDAIAFFTNPLPLTIKSGEFRIEGPGLAKQLKLKVIEETQPGEDLRVEFKILPSNIGKASVIAKFFSKELDDVDGFLEFMVAPQSEKANGAT